LVIITAKLRKPDLAPSATPAGLIEWHRLQTSGGRKLYGKRKYNVETIFGIVKSAIGFRLFLLRHVKKVTRRVEVRLHRCRDWGFWARRDQGMQVFELIKAVQTWKGPRSGLSGYVFATWTDILQFVGVKRGAQPREIASNSNTC
jgi:hypothetical protein